MKCRSWALVAFLGVGAAGLTACGGPRASRLRMAEPDREDRWVERFGDVELVVYAHPSLEPEIHALFDVLHARVEQGATLDDGFSLHYGWTTLRVVREAEGELVLREPDYDAEDPGVATRADLSVSLEVFAAQRLVTGNALASPQPVNYDQQLLVARGALDEARVYLLRVPSPGGHLSGWRVAGTDVALPDAEAEYVPVHELLERRPALLSAMQLPDGYMAFFDGDSVEIIVGRDNEPVWVRPGLADEEPGEAEPGPPDGLEGFEPQRAPLQTTPN